MHINIKGSEDIQVKEKGRKRTLKSMIQNTSDNLEEKVDSSRCKKKPWTHEEDRQLIQLVKEYGPQKWSLIASYLEGRMGKQCRERWHNHLNPILKKSQYSEQEEWVIYLFHKAIGNKWAVIAKYIVGRTDNSIKNHWNSGMKKRLENLSLKLDTLREIYENNIGESFFDREMSVGEKKALEILFMNKQYVSSDEEDDDDDCFEEGDEEQNQNKQKNNNKNGNSLLNPDLRKSDSAQIIEELDTQKTKEKASVQSKSEVNPFQLNIGDEQNERNASTIKKQIPQSQNKQSLSHILSIKNKKENKMFKRVSTALEIHEDILSSASALKENQNLISQLSSDYNVIKQTNLIKDKIKKKLKVERSSIIQESLDDKRIRQAYQNENKVNTIGQKELYQNLSVKRNNANFGIKQIDKGESEECMNKFKRDENAFQKIEQIQMNNYKNFCQYNEDDNQQYIHHQQYSLIPPVNQSNDEEFHRQIQNNQYDQYIQNSMSYNPYQSDSQTQMTYPLKTQQKQLYYTNNYMDQIYSSTQINQIQDQEEQYLHYQNKHLKHSQRDQKYHSVYNVSKECYTLPQYPHQPNQYYQNEYDNLYYYPHPQDSYYLMNGFENLDSEIHHSYYDKNTIQQSFSKYSYLQYPENQQLITFEGQKYYYSPEKKHLKKQYYQKETKDRKHEQQLQQYSSRVLQNITNSLQKQKQNKIDKQSNKGIYYKTSIEKQIHQSPINKIKNNTDINYIYYESGFKNLNMQNNDNKSIYYSAMSTKSLNKVNNYEDKENEDNTQTIFQSSQKPIRNNDNNITKGQLANNSFQQVNQNNQNLNQVICYESPSKMLNLSEKVNLQTISSNKQRTNNFNSNIKIPMQRHIIHPLKQTF